MKVRVGLVVMVCLVVGAAMAAPVGAAVKKFATKTTVEETSSGLTGKVTSSQAWCTRHANVDVSSVEDELLGGNTETNGSGVWTVSIPEVAGHTFVVTVKSPNGYGPKLNKKDRVACKTTKVTLKF
jgi:hypothetical protein